MTWQPIETAPKDGKWIDLWWEDDAIGNRIPDCHWSLNDYWVDSSGNVLGDEFVLFWMEIPHPPKQTTSPKIQGGAR